MTALTQVIRLDPSAAAAHHLLGYAHSSLGNKKRAFQAFESAVKLQSKNAESRFFLGLVSLSLGKRDLAIEQFRKLEELDSVFAKRLYEVIYQDKVISVEQASSP